MIWASSGLAGGSLGALLGRLGGLLGGLGGLLGASWAVLGASWAVLGGILDRLVCSWRSWKRPGPFRGRILAPLLSETRVFKDLARVRRARGRAARGRRCGPPGPPGILLQKEELEGRIG